jgi:nitrogen fixation-related uncharacterized protein
MIFTEGDWGILAMSAAMFIIFVGFLIWGILSGQFKNVEEPKYRMLQDDREEDTKTKKKDGNRQKRGGAE